MHTKKYRASPLTDKKKSNSVRRREKNIEQTENLPPPPPPHQKSNGPSLIWTLMSILSGLTDDYISN